MLWIIAASLTQGCSSRAARPETAKSQLDDASLTCEDGSGFCEVVGDTGGGNGPTTGGDGATIAGDAMEAGGEKLDVTLDTGCVAAAAVKAVPDGWAGWQLKLSSAGSIVEGLDSASTETYRWTIAAHPGVPWPVDADSFLLPKAKAANPTMFTMISGSYKFCLTLQCGDRAKSTACVTYDLAYPPERHVRILHTPVVKLGAEVANCVTGARIQSAADASLCAAPSASACCFGPSNWPANVYGWLPALLGEGTLTLASGVTVVGDNAGPVPAADVIRLSAQVPYASHDAVDLALELFPLLPAQACDDHLVLLQYVSGGSVVWSSPVLFLNATQGNEKIPIGRLRLADPLPPGVPRFDACAPPMAP